MEGQSKQVAQLIEATFITKSIELNNDAILYLLQLKITKFQSSSQVFCILNKPAITSHWLTAIRPATWSRSRWPLDVIVLPLAKDIKSWDVKFMIRSSHDASKIDKVLYKRTIHN